MAEDGTQERTPLLHDDLRPANGSASTETTADEETTVIVEGLATTQLAVIMGTVMVGVFFAAADQSIVATLSPAISSEFESLSLLSWLAASYFIANAAFQPISGRLTDVYGRRAGLLGSNALFGLGNLLCGLARNEAMILAGRVVSGVGGGGLMSIATFLASDLVPLRKRGLIQGIANLAYGCGLMLGGVFGGIMNDTSEWGWRLAFLVQVPVSLVSLVLVLFLNNLPPKASRKSKLSRIDFLGAVLIIAFLVSLLLGLNAGGNLVEWTDPLVLVTLPLSLVALCAFVWQENRTQYATIPVKLLLDRTVFAACAANLLSSMAYLMLFFYIPLYLQVLGHSSTQAGLRLLAAPVGASSASLGTVSFFFLEVVRSLHGRRASRVLD
jgi:MFS family permease